MVVSGKNPMFERRVQKLLKRMNRLNKLHSEQMHAQQKQDNYTEKTQEQKRTDRKQTISFSRSDMINGLRMGMSMAKQIKLMERFSNSRQERQLTAKERQRLRERTRARTRQHTREGYSR